MIRLFLRAVDLVSRTAAILAGVMLIAAMLVICEMIFLRYVFRAPTIWQTDFVVFSATAAMFLGAPYVLQTKGHVGVDVIEIALPPGPRRALGILGALLGLLFAVLMTIASAMFFHEAYVNEWRTSTVAAITLWIPLLPLPVSFALLSLQYVAELVRRLCGVDQAQGHA
ncbi:TRAP transporter small permease [Ancylobacter dichloromethanicus]|uniref:TRAP transporter small permease protein n=1 Tax=Ancylobacter dichloromethanicus TaxID=518825 RepID=A0A9W6MYZ3_9HYPH|nr:TRAP transporter small permease [Ancylobacter dichloromethanicus]MBS7554420.1 TRAP transporter small permease [Ancylobacter dichloromethanicus]GLK71546.1 TRAP transporter small permease protein [Ancylobacter dichloromethanicus]